jgi:hypothetical protein
MTESHTKDILDPNLLTFTGDLITVSSQTGLPPGSRVQFQLTVTSSPEPIPLFGKVVSVALHKDGRFRLAIRLHGLTRKQSALLSIVDTNQRT